MQAQEIETYLAELGQALQNLGVRQPICVLMVGGAFMSTQVSDRRTTNDIDIVLKNVENDSSLQSYQSFKLAVRSVANRHNIPVSWINDVISDFLYNISIVPEGTLWRSFDMLEVYIPPEEYILALKLLAGRQKDKDDIRILCQKLQIRTRQRARQLVDQYIPDKQTQQINSLDDTLDDFFP